LLSVSPRHGRYVQVEIDSERLVLQRRLIAAEVSRWLIARSRLGDGDRARRIGAQKHNAAIASQPRKDGITSPLSFECTSSHSDFYAGLGGDDVGEVDLKRVVKRTTVREHSACLFAGRERKNTS
jgi:hypothetical protein